MHIQTVPLSFSANAIVVESNCLKSRASAVRCSVSRNNACIPKLEPFSRNKFDRAVKEPPLIQKAENQIAGKVSSLFRMLSFLSGNCVC